MKIKLCPKCGKQNDVNAWNCIDCGATLSMNTMVDVGDLQSSQVAIAGKGVLFSVSPFYQDDLTELIKNNTRSSESIVKGCDVCKPSILPPYKFGYLVLTSHQLICVDFKADTEVHLWTRKTLPKRHYLVRETVGHTLIDGRPQDDGFLFMDRPSYPLTSTEKSDREVSRFLIKTLYSTELADDLFLNLKFRHGDGTLDDFSITFYFNDEAFEIYRLLEEHLKK